MSILQNILYDTLYHNIPIILCAIGGSFAYKANILNIALEGMMLNGAFLSTLLVLLTGNVYFAVFIAVIGTLLLGLVFSLLGITCKGNVIIVGFGINLIVSAVAKYIFQFY